MPSDRTPYVRSLWEAVAKLQFEKVEKLLARGASVDRDPDCLPTAAAIPPPEGLRMVLLLLDHGADVNLANEDGVTALHRAAEHGHGPTIRALIERGASMKRGTVGGQKPLHYAARAPRSDAVCLLVELGADLEAIDDVGRTALHQAASDGQREIARLLVELGARRSARDHAGAMPAELASEKHHRLLAAELHPEPDVALVRDALLQAAREDDPTGVARWATFPGVSDGERAAAFDVAVPSRPRAARALIDAGVPLTEPLSCVSPPANLDVWTAFGAVARARFSPEIAGAMLDAGLEPDARPHGSTLLHVIAMRTAAPPPGDPLPYRPEEYRAMEELARRLIELGADVNVCDGDGRTPLYVACRYGNVTSLPDLLIGAGGETSSDPSLGLD